MINNWKSENTGHQAGERHKTLPSLRMQDVGKPQSRTSVERKISILIQTFSFLRIIKFYSKIGKLLSLRFRIERHSEKMCYSILWKYEDIICAWNTQNSNLERETHYIDGLADPWFAPAVLCMRWSVQNALRLCRT